MEKKIKCFTYRFDIENTPQNRQFLKKWLKQFDKYMMSIEHGKQTGKPHYQGLLFTTKGEDTLRRGRPFPLHGSSYSIAPVKDLEKYESYLTKEELYSYKGYTEDYIKSIPVWQDFPTKQTVSKKSFLSTVIEEFKNTAKNTDYNIRSYSKHIISMLKKKVKVYDYTIYERLLYGLYLAVDKDAEKTIEKEFFSVFQDKKYNVEVICPSVEKDYENQELDVLDLQEVEDSEEDEE